MYWSGKSWLIGSVMSWWHEQSIKYAGNQLWCGIAEVLPIGFVVLFNALIILRSYWYNDFKSNWPVISYPPPLIPAVFSFGLGSGFARLYHYFTKQNETRHPGSFFVGPSRRAGHGRKDAPYLYKRDLYYLLTCVMYSMFFALWLHMLDHDHSGSVSICIQLFRERLSEKVHATIPKGIVGGFELTSSSMIFEKMARERPWTYLC